MLLMEKGHQVTVVGSKPERSSPIEALDSQLNQGKIILAKGKMDDVAFLTEMFWGADIVFLMEAINANKSAYFDEDIDIDSEHFKLADNFSHAINNSGVSKVVHLSNIGAHTGYGVGLLNAYFYVEETLKALPESISIKFMRPVCFYYSLFSLMPAIKKEGMIFQNYGGDQKEPWVSPSDIAQVISEVHYIASDEVSPNEVAHILGKAIGKPDLKWQQVSDEQFIFDLLYLGMKPNVARGIAEMNRSRVNGVLYEDYYRNKPKLGKVKFKDFAKLFAKMYYLK